VGKVTEVCREQKNPHDRQSRNMGQEIKRRMFSCLRL
jgi:hypothetical protein